MLHDLTALNARYGSDAPAILRFALSGALGKIALVSSFGADSAVLLHLVAEIAPATPVLFIDTLLLFEETLHYQRALAQRLNLRDLRVITPARVDLFTEDADGVLHEAAPDACCDLRKTRPLNAALAGFDGWITGRKRFQGGARAGLAAFERDAQSGQLKINPLAGWAARDLAAYLVAHDLPRHPLVAKGFASIGCAPCTGPVAPGEDARAGRWRGQDKDECGIHIVDGRVIRRQAS